MHAVCMCALVCVLCIFCGCVQRFLEHTHTIPLMSSTAEATELGMRGSGRSLKKAFRVLLMAVSHRPREATSSWESGGGREGGREGGERGECVGVHISE